MQILLSRKSTLLDGKIKANFSIHVPFSDASKSLLPISVVVSFKLRVPFVEISAIQTSFWTIQTLLRSSDFYRAKITPEVSSLEGTSLSKTLVELSLPVWRHVSLGWNSKWRLIGDVEVVDKNAEFPSDILPHLLRFVNMWFILH